MPWTSQNLPVACNSLDGWFGDPHEDRIVRPAHAPPLHPIGRGVRLTRLKLQDKTNSPDAASALNQAVGAARENSCAFKRAPKSCNRGMQVAQKQQVHRSQQLP